MAHRSESFKGLCLLWCVLGNVFSVPTPTPSPLKSEDVRYTTRRIPKTIVDLPTQRSRSPIYFHALNPMNLEISTSSTTSMPTTTTTHHKSISGENPIYRLNGTNGQACILLQTDAVIAIKYRTILGEDRVASLFVPDDATVTGNCDNENTVTMSLKWDAFVLFWSFAKFLVVCFSHRNMKLQPFKFKNNEFAAEFSCASLSARANRDETAPVAVGSTLAAAVLLTITGYAVYRYFKVKKVKYDTME
ncbi:PREDICTED: uncharacterized protein LOC106786750 [Polistes canadensis]|uniref:uncharacterized protein LOC106786750 n=1 Tax=Polistes canadensis TaxID=91411 RepID=UPI000718CF06|nr:PREDICTED: uncharacterized protein LOC106786750 [Polistes canadensis]